MRILDLSRLGCQNTKDKFYGRGKYIHYAIIHDGRDKYRVEGYNHNRSTYRGDLHCSFHAEMDAVSKLMSKRLVGEENPAYYEIQRKTKKLTITIVRDNGSH